jgi:hypothetical protein
MKQIRRGYALLRVAVGLLLAACGTISVDDYRDQKPRFELEKFFDGKLIAKGALYDRSGALTRRFTADIVGTVKGDEVQLDEVFSWSDGEKQIRTWQLKKTGPDAYTGTAGDVIGTALGRGAGNAFNWSYTLRVKTESGEVDVKMDDWIYLIDERTVLNRTDMTFYGLHVGEVVLVIEKVAS